ncbi:protein SMALL AUXIN UP-REGULATED RNA 54-like [Cicer arietinum]|uniref:Auxin-responsive protein SAUR32-like n=1 Tax=Cicer arietinum TaxID=3827 RepID=A0A1S2XPW3_CICAR|nr:auxin-responsive protein SAUR32-like [Cicer arietinum]
MDSKSHMKGKVNKKLGMMITKTWERCKSIGRGGYKSKYSSSTINPTATRRSKSWPIRRGDEKGEKKLGSVVVPQGYFCVYVGPQMQKFVIKTEYCNHPLFKILLEEAETEYGYSSQGPLALPCNVDVFYKVLMEMDSEVMNSRQGCAFRGNYRSRSSYHLLSPSRILALNNS